MATKKSIKTGKLLPSKKFKKKSGKGRDNLRPRTER